MFCQVGACRLSEGAFCLLKDRPQSTLLSRDSVGDERPRQGLRAKFVATTGNALRAVM